MPAPVSPEKLAIIAQMLMSHRPCSEIAKVVGITPAGVRYIRDKLANPPTIEYHETTTRVYETDEMAQRLSALMSGQSFGQNVRTKSYGRAPLAETHVMSESNLARCG